MCNVARYRQTVCVFNLYFKLPLKVLAYCGTTLYIYVDSKSSYCEKIVCIPCINVEINVTMFQLLLDTTRLGA